MCGERVYVGVTCTEGCDVCMGEGGGTKPALYSTHKKTASSTMLTWMYSVRVRNTCLATLKAFRKFSLPCRSMVS